MKSPRSIDWPAAAGHVAGKVERGRLCPAVTRWADACPPREPWAIALSGGADSVLLLLVIWAHWPERRKRLRALHFDHRLRGAKSAGDAAFCARVCDGLGISLTTGAWKRPRGPVSEAGARTARFDFFEKQLARKKIRATWFGHQQDDVVETLFMRLARGSGSAGLAAPRPVQVFANGRVHLRPLIGFKKSEIIQILRKAGVPWREDATNSQGTYLRNRLRRDVIPRWVQASGRDAASGAALSRSLIEEDDTALELWVDRVGALTAEGNLDLKKLSCAPRAVVRRALHRWLLAQPGLGGLSRQGFDALLESVERGAPTCHSLGVGSFGVIKKGFLRFEEQPRPTLRNRRRRLFQKVGKSTLDSAG